MFHIWENYDTLFTQYSSKFSVRKEHLSINKYVEELNKQSKSLNIFSHKKETVWRAYSSVECLMDPLRWACSSTFGIETQNSIFLSLSFSVLLTFFLYLLFLSHSVCV